MNRFSPLLGGVAVTGGQRWGGFFYNSLPINSNAMTHPFPDKSGFPSQEGNKNWLGLIKCLFESIYFQTSDLLNEFEARFSLL